MKHLPLTLTLIALIMTPMALASAPVTHAEELTLRVAPARQEYQLDPGETTAITLKFFNLADQPTNGMIRAADFIVQDNEGTPTIVDTVEQASPKYSGATWVTLPYDQMAIAPQDKVIVQARITVPQNARPGGRYVAVYFEPFTSTQGQLSGSKAPVVNQRIAGLVYIRVNGPITEKALVSRIYAPSFQEYGPLKVEADVINQGDYHVRPQGSVSVKNMFGGFVDQQKVQTANIFPDALRTFESTIGQKWMFGRYTIEFLAAYGTTGQVVKRSIAVWVLPWKILLSVALGLILLTLIVKKTYTRFIFREKKLESQLRSEQHEIDALKDQLNRK